MKVPDASRPTTPITQSTASRSPKAYRITSNVATAGGLATLPTMLYGLYNGNLWMSGISALLGLGAGGLSFLTERWANKIEGEMVSTAMKKGIDSALEQCFYSVEARIRNLTHIPLPEEARKLIDEGHKEEVVKALISCLSDNSTSRLIKGSVAKILGEIKAVEAEDLLLAGLKEEKGNGPFQLFHTAMMEALGNLGSKKAVPVLVSIIKSGDEDLSSQSAKALGKMKELDILIELLQDNDISIGIDAVGGLVEAGQDAIEPLQQLFAQEPKNAEILQRMQIAVDQIVEKLETEKWNRIHAN